MMISEARQSGSLLVFLTLSFALTPPTASAQNFEELEARLRDHPALQAMRHQSVGFRENAQAAGALPDPVLSVGVLNFPLFDPSFTQYLPTSKAVGVRQQFPNRAFRAAKTQEAERRALQNDAATNQRFAELRVELIVSLIEQQRIARQRILLMERDSKYDELAAIVETEINAGRPALFRLAEIDIERAEVVRALADLEAEANQIGARLVDLVGEPVSTPPPLPRQRDWSGDAATFHAVRVAEAGISLAETAVDKAEASWQPDWGVQLTYQQRDGPGDDWVTGVVTFTVPFWAERSQEPRLRAAAAGREAARGRFMAAARGALARYSSLDATRAAAVTGIEVLEQKITAIEDRVAAQLTIYESGAGDYSPILDGEIAVLASRSQIAQEQARRDGAIARMNALLAGS